jgi:hypothetical protein
MQRRGADIPVLLPAHQRRVRALRPRGTTAGRRVHDHRPGGHHSLRVPPGDRNPEPRHLPDSGPVRPRPTMDCLGRPERLEPQAVLSVRRQLQHLPHPRPRAECTDRPGTVTRVHGRDLVVERPRWQLQLHRLRGIGDDAQGTHHRTLRRDPVHVRARTVRRVDPATRDRQRLPRPARRHPAERQLRGHVVRRTGRGRRLSPHAPGLQHGVTRPVDRPSAAGGRVRWSVYKILSEGVHRCP